MAPNPKCPSADLKESLDIGGGFFLLFFFLTHQAILISTQGYIHCLFLFLLLIIIVSCQAQWRSLTEKGLLSGRLGIWSSIWQRAVVGKGDSHSFQPLLDKGPHEARWCWNGRKSYSSTPIQDSQVFNQGRRLSLQLLLKGHWIIQPACASLSRWNPEISIINIMQEKVKTKGNAIHLLWRDSNANKTLKNIFIYLFMYLTASDLSCSMQGSLFSQEIFSLECELSSCDSWVSAFVAHGLGATWLVGS